jgi:signal transduction histidine kinase
MQEKIPQATEFDLSAFLRGLAHEIANPLNAVTMNSELVRLLLDRGDSARAREVADRLSTDCARCSRLMRELQRFASNVRVQALVHVCVSDVLEGAKRAIALEYSGTLPAFQVEALDANVTADPVALQRALAALLRNAADAGADKVTLAARREGARIIIDISDNGSGFSADELVRVAEPFYSTRRADGALGLGLTLARELLRQHGGELAIFSNTPCGARAEVRLPAAAAA